MSPATDPVGAAGDPEVADPADAARAHAGADSAGVPWAGRSFDANPHAADDGRAPEALAAAIRRFRAGDGGQGDVVAEFGRSRVLIPLLAELGDGGAEVGAHGLSVDKSQELSIVTVEGPDGRRVLPVFASVDAMAQWNPAARPVPADGVRVALAAADDGTDLVVLDPGSDGEFVLRRPAVWAVAQSLLWHPPFDSPDVREAFERSIGTELAVLGVDLEAGDPDARLAGPELVVRLRLVAGLTRTELDAVLQRLAARWAADDAIATLVDSLTVRLVST
ncbi:type III secretion system (T3SS) SseB-like protein [Agromyces ramosus]|uniref:Type III secretion system (T3SS) SseB-like protein n=1 Tax=Agromyces ramosus TaxID=33879 RepID=A0A4Q7MLF5_9MICO|nr:SseB family protein [Agromyces ramosus]RZS67612.1 type III secretion system (T3SS) SseB-like protein [Agromyces ramosus]